jgi:hypothetical protein
LNRAYHRRKTKENYDFNKELSNRWKIEGDIEETFSQFRRRIKRNK